MAGQGTEEGRVQEGTAGPRLPEPDRLQVALGALQAKRSGPDGGGVDGGHDGGGAGVRAADGRGRWHTRTSGA